MAESTDLRPNWDLTPYFPEFNGDAYREFRAELDRDLGALRERVARLRELHASNLGEWAELLCDTESASARLLHLGGYLGCMGAADSRDEDVARETASVSGTRAELEKVLVGIRAALAHSDDATFSELVGHPELADVAHFVERMRERSRWAMAADMEELAADLDVNGLSAWGRLYSQVTGSLEFDFEKPGEPTRRLPVAITRSLLEDPDPQVRRAAFTGANRAWEQSAEVLAACLNAIAGTRLTLYERREVDSYLEPALFDSAIHASTLDTLMDTVDARCEVARRYLRRKAEILELDALGFEDLGAPLPIDGETRVAWDEASTRLLDAFGGFSPALRELATHAVEREWIDYESRPGKRPGGFCSTSPVIGESRVFMTYNGALGDVRTLAHELGHAYHGWVMRDMRPWARRYPMTLAETASTFAEQIFTDHVLDDPDTSEQDRAAILDSRMQFAAVFLLNIPTRFRFERAFYEERAAGEVSVTRLCELMSAAQRSCYGDTLREDGLNPWMWASTLHFYITGLSFYNFPYTFGYLFSLGIFAKARELGTDFLPAYDELLRRTGNESAEDVARNALGVDLERPGFWNASIDLIESDLDRFLGAAEKLFPRE